MIYYEQEYSKSVISNVLEVMKQEEWIAQFQKLDSSDEFYLNQVEYLLKEGLDANGLNRYGDSLLSEAVFDLFFEEKWPPVLELIQLFVKYGYDVRTQNGVFGSDLLSQLSFVDVIDDKLVEVADYVLSLGADPTVIYDGDSAVSWTGSTACDGWVCNDYVRGCIGEILWRIYYRASKSQTYQGIRTHLSYVGKQIVDAKVLFRKQEYYEQFPVITPDNLKEVLRYAYLLLYVNNEKTPLVLSYSSSLFVDPYWDWSEYYTSDYQAYAEVTVVNDWIGQTLENVEVTREGDDTDFVGIRLCFSNGTCIAACDKRFDF